MYIFLKVHEHFNPINLEKKRRMGGGGGKNQTHTYTIDGGTFSVPWTIGSNTFSL